MNNHGTLQLREPEMMPTNYMLEQVLGDSYAMYEKLQEDLPNLEIEQQWQWYTPCKAWFAKGQHFWTTPRGTKKEKNLYWLYVYDKYFRVAVWFKEKNHEEVLSANVSEITKRCICDAKTMGKLPTFAVEVDITTPELLTDVYILLDYKKRLER